MSTPYPYPYPPPNPYGKPEGGFVVKVLVVLVVVAIIVFVVFMTRDEEKVEEIVDADLITIDGVSYPNAEKRIDTTNPLVCGHENAQPELIQSADGGTSCFTCKERGMAFMGKGCEVPVDESACVSLLSANATVNASTGRCDCKEGWGHDENGGACNVAYRLCQGYGMKPTTKPHLCACVDPDAEWSAPSIADGGDGRCSCACVASASAGTPVDVGDQGVQGEMVEMGASEDQCSVTCAGAPDGGVAFSHASSHPTTRVTNSYDPGIVCGGESRDPCAAGLAWTDDAKLACVCATCEGDFASDAGQIKDPDRSCCSSSEALGECQEGRDACVVSTCASADISDSHCKDCGGGGACQICCDGWKFNPATGQCDVPIPSEEEMAEAKTVLAEAKTVVTETEAVYADSKTVVTEAETVYAEAQEDREDLDAQVAAAEERYEAETDPDTKNDLAEQKEVLEDQRAEAVDTVQQASDELAQAKESEEDAGGAVAAAIEDEQTLTSVYDTMAAAYANNKTESDDLYATRTTTAADDCTQKQDDFDAGELQACIDQNPGDLSQCESKYSCLNLCAKDGDDVADGYGCALTTLPLQEHSPYGYALREIYTPYWPPTEEPDSDGNCATPGYEEDAGVCQAPCASGFVKLGNECRPDFAEEQCPTKDDNSGVSQTRTILVKDPCNGGAWQSYGDQNEANFIYPEVSANEFKDAADNATTVSVTNDDEDGSTCELGVKWGESACTCTDGDKIFDPKELMANGKFHCISTPNCNAHAALYMNATDGGFECHCRDGYKTNIIESGIRVTFPDNSYKSYDDLDEAYAGVQSLDPTVQFTKGDLSTATTTHQTLAGNYTAERWGDDKFEESRDLQCTECRPGFAKDGGSVCYPSSCGASNCSDHGTCKLGYNDAYTIQGQAPGRSEMRCVDKNDRVGCDKGYTGLTCDTVADTTKYCGLGKKTYTALSPYDCANHACALMSEDGKVGDDFRRSVLVANDGAHIKDTEASVCEHSSRRADSTLFDDSWDGAKPRRDDVDAFTLDTNRTSYTATALIAGKWTNEQVDAYERTTSGALIVPDSIKQYYTCCRPKDSTELRGQVWVEKRDYNKGKITEETFTNAANNGMGYGYYYPGNSGGEDFEMVESNRKNNNKTKTWHKRTRHYPLNYPTRWGNGAKWYAHLQPLNPANLAGVKENA